MRIVGVGQWCERVRDCIARLVMPGLEVGCLGRTDAEQYPQHFKIGDLQGQNWVEAAATLLDEAEMEGSGVGDGLDVALRAEVGIRHWDGGKLPAAQTRDRLGKLEAGIEIGVFRAAAVPGVPARVHRELHEIGEPADLVGSSGLTARQGAKLIEVDRVRALGSQVGVQEVPVGEFIVGIVVDVLRHVGIKVVESGGIGRTPPGRQAGDLVVLDAAEFGVLQPQIGFNGFDGGQECEDSDVSLGHSVGPCGSAFGQ